MLHTNTEAQPEPASATEEKPSCEERQPEHVWTRPSLAIRTMFGASGATAPPAKMSVSKFCDAPAPTTDKPYVHPPPPTPPPGYALPEMYDGWTVDGRCVLVFVMPGPVSHKITIEPAPPLGPVEGYKGCVLFADNGGVHYTGGHRDTGSLRQIIQSLQSTGLLGST